MIPEGSPALGFTLPDQDGNTVSLAAFAGRTVVLYFYPRADTPGCTTQAWGIRDRAAEYEAAGAVVIGVSPDSVQAVKRFHGRQSLNFTLLADADHQVCEAYGVWVEKAKYGKRYWGAERSTYIIGPMARWSVPSHAFRPRPTTTSCCRRWTSSGPAPDGARRAPARPAQPGSAASPISRSTTRTSFHSPSRQPWRRCTPTS